MRALILILALGPAAALAEAGPSRINGPIDEGHSLYLRGELARSAAAYERAILASSHSVSGWLNAAVVYDELGLSSKAISAYQAASRLSADPDIVAALGWSQRRAGDLAGAEQSFARALVRAPEHAWALLGAGRCALDSSKPDDAVRHLQKAAAAAPLYNLTHFYLGKAFDALGDSGKAIEAYRQAVIADSYFHEGRDALARAYMRHGSYNEAYRQFSRAQEAEPKSRRFGGLLNKLRPLLRRGPATPGSAFSPLPALAPAEVPGPSIPRIRVGIGTTADGKPRARQSAAFKATCAFDARDAKTGRRLLAGEPEENYHVRVRRVKKSRLLVLSDGSGRSLLQRSGAIQIHPRDAASCVLALDPAAGRGGGAAGRILRGKLELALHRGDIKLVNELDLENYTHGVVSAEMPIKSPLEALKAQAVMARTHALYIKKVYKNRHKKEGYDLCDGQHCQVYVGARAESQRSREVVTATRGKILQYRGGVAHVIYMSNCGGHTQNAGELTGWGDSPYLIGLADGPQLERPRGPWELRRWLHSWPQAYCRPSNDVHPSHYRWTRAIPARELQEKLDRKLKLGRLTLLRPLRRSPSGNVNSLLVHGLKRKAKIDSEIQIRGLLGLGSLRSTLFVMDIERGPDGRPETLIFHGGGWGHGVGLCQSGAMGRADAGHGFEQIVTGYFKGTELGELRY